MSRPDRTVVAPPGVQGPLLVIAHEATRTGAPRVLLDLLRVLKEERRVPMSVRLECGGPLADDLLALADAGLDGGAAPSAILVNSALAAAALRSAPDVPAALYVHEDRAALDLLARSARDAMAGYERVLCVTDTVATDVEGLGVDRERIRVVPPLVSPRTAVEPQAIAGAREVLGARRGDVIVLGCGEASWRKGADLFVALSRYFDDSPHVVFGWVGLRPPPYSRVLEHDASLVGLGDRIRWIGEVAEPEPYLAAADVLVVTSRYDPQPLVPVEAGLLGTPTVGFAVGGVSDLARSGAALAVDYPDVEGLARSVRRVVGRSELSDELVRRARRRWRIRQSPQVVLPRFVTAMGDLLPPAARAAFPVSPADGGAVPAGRRPDPRGRHLPASSEGRDRRH